MKKIARLNIFQFLAAVLVFLVSPSFSAESEDIMFSAEYYVVEDGKVVSFYEYGKTVYSTWPVPYVFSSSGLDVIPVLMVDDKRESSWLSLDSVIVKSSRAVVVYTKGNGLWEMFLQDFVQDVDVKATVQLFYGVLPDSQMKKHMVISNMGSIPLTITEMNSKLTINGGASDSLPIASDLLITLDRPAGVYLDSLYMYFYVDYSELIQSKDGAYAAPSNATLAALDSCRFTMNISSERVYLSNDIKRVMKILRDDGYSNVDGIVFKMEIFQMSSKRAHSFVFKKDLENTFYDVSWTDTIHVDRNVHNFPTVYSNDSCYDGWTIVSRGLGGRLFKNTEFNLSLLKIDGEILYMEPVWRSGPDCYSDVVTLDSEHGHLELLQIVSGDTIVRALKDSLRIPHSENGLNFVVRAVPDSAYELDGLVAYEADAPVVYPSGTNTLYVENGRTLNIAHPAVIRAKFVPAPDPENLRIDVPGGLEVSGNAVRLRYETGEMNILRKITMRLSLVGDSGVVLDSVLVDSAETTSLRGEWILLPAPVGNYKVVAQLSHDRDTATFTDSLKVMTEIAIDSRSWGMVSLSAVDLKKYDWSGDQLLYRWDESYGGAEFYQYRRLKKNDKFKSTDGYWYNSLEGRSLVLGKENYAEASFTWELDSLNSGWNLVSNPHGYYVELKSSSKDSIEFWRWNAENGEYEIPKVLAPYEAVWARVKKHVTLTLDGEPVYDESRWDAAPEKSRGALAKKGGAEDWELRVALSDKDGHKDSWNFLGTASSRFEMEEPPSAMGDYVYLSILGENGSGLAKSVLRRAKNDVYEWNLELGASSERDGYVTIEGVDALRSKGLRVFVTVDGKTTEMSEETKLNVRLGSASKKALVRVASEPRKAISYALGGLKARSTVNGVFVEFDAGDAYEQKAARVDLLDVKGNVVASERFYAKNGSNFAKLNVSRSGFYMARVKVGSKTLISKVLVR